MRNFCILPAQTYEGGLHLNKEEVVQHFPLLFIGGGRHLQEVESFLHEGMSVYKKKGA